MKVYHSALVSLRALTRNLILHIESRQYEVPGQAREDTEGVKFHFDTPYTEKQECIIYNV